MSTANSVSGRRHEPLGTVSNGAAAGTGPNPLAAPLVAAPEGPQSLLDAEAAAGSRRLLLATVSSTVTSDVGVATGTYPAANFYTVQADLQIPILQPYLAINYIVELQGYFPSQS